MKRLWIILISIFLLTGCSFFQEKSLGEQIFGVKEKLFIDGLALVQDQNNKYGYINKKGKEVIEAIYDDANPFFKRRALVKLGDDYQFINRAGKAVVKLQYDYVYPLVPSPHVYVYRSNKKYGLLNNRGKKLTEAVYDIIYTDFIAKDGLIIAEQDKKIGFIDVKGNEITDFIYEDAEMFFSGLAPVKKQGKYGYINKKGEEVIDFIYDEATSFRDGYAMVTLDNEMFWIDKKGSRQNEKFNSKTIADRVLTGLEPYHIILNNKEYEFYKNLKMTHRIDAQSLIDDFENTNAADCLIPIFDDYILKMEGAFFNSKNTLYKLKHNEIVKTYNLIDYKYLINFSYILFIGKTVDETIIITPNKTYSLDLGEDIDLWDVNRNGMIIFRRDGRFGIIDFKGQKIVDNDYNLIQTAGSLFIYELDGKYGILDKKGKVIVENKYRDIIHNYTNV